MNNVIHIGNINVAIDEEGRYCLNDLHHAASGEKKHQPSDFLRAESTQGLIVEVNSGNSRSSAVVSKAGRYGGTFVCKELVYAYAMWISPSFHLKVIRAFDRLETRGVAVADHVAADLQKNPPVETVGIPALN